MALAENFPEPSEDLLQTYPKPRLVSDKKMPETQHFGFIRYWTEAPAERTGKVFSDEQRQDLLDHNGAV